MEWEYPVKLEKDSNGTYLVTFPDFDDAVTFGEDKKDALFRAQGALHEVISARIAAREKIPNPSKKKGNALVTIDATVQAKVLLYKSMQEQKLKKSDLAKRLHVDQKQIDRLLDVKHNSTFQQLSSAFAAVGHKMLIQMA